MSAGFSRWRWPAVFYSWRISRLPKSICPNLHRNRPSMARYGKVILDNYSGAEPSAVVFDSRIEVPIR